jgi:6-phosphogluconolactonase
MKQVVYVASPESQQIHVFQLDEQGALNLLQVVEVPGQVQPMTISPNRRHLYVGVRPNFAVITYQIDDKGQLQQVASAPLPGSPTHFSTDKLGRFLFSTSYSFNNVSISPIDEEGVVQAPQYQLENLQAPHSANIDSTNQLLLIPALKEDRIRLFDFKRNGKVAIHHPEALQAVSGSGPRHMTFHPNQQFAYCANELNSTVAVYQKDSLNGEYRCVQTLNIMPASFTGTRWAADIHITPDGRYLYVSDRTASILAIFQVSDDGSVLSLVGHHATQTQPRGFNIDNSGRFVIVAGQKSDAIEVAQIDAQTGMLSVCAEYPVGKGPMWVSILALDEKQ